MDNIYDDIIDLGRPDHGCHTPMSMDSRAGQFSSFAALNGHAEAIDETARLTDSYVEASRDRQLEMSAALISALERLPERPRLCVTVFRPDSRKAGGRYERVRGVLLGMCDMPAAIKMESAGSGAVVSIPLSAVTDIEPLPESGE